MNLPNAATLIPLIFTIPIWAGAQTATQVLEQGKLKAKTCNACHGAQGNSPTPYWPSLAGQTRAYTQKQLSDFRSGQRQNELMAPMTSPLSKEDIEAIAVYYASLEPMKQPGARVENQKGMQIFQAGIPERGIPPCSSCHGPQGRGNETLGYPAIAGQRADYNKLQILAFRKNARTNDPSGLMRQAVKNLSYPEIKAVVAYLERGIGPAE